MLLGFRALESSLKITNLMVVPRLSLCAFSSSLDVGRAPEWLGCPRLPPPPPRFPPPRFPPPGAPDAEHVVVEQDLGLQADLDQVGDDVHVLGAVRAAVHAHGHEQVLGRPGQLWGGQGGGNASAPWPGPPAGPRAHGAPHLGVLQPHLQLLHRHQPHLLVAAGGGEQPQQVPRDVVNGLPPGELVAQHVEDVLLHALRQLLVPRPEGGRQAGGKAGARALRGAGPGRAGPRSAPTWAWAGPPDRG